MLGYEPDAFPAGYESWRRLLHPDDAEAAETALQAHIAGSGNSFAIEFRMRERMGGWRWILGRGMVVERDAAGDAVRLAGSHSDISERKRAEENLRLTQLAMDRSSDGIFRVDPDGRFGYVNEQACRSLGYSRDELLGLHVWEIDPDFPDTQWPSQWETLQQTGRRVFESRHRRKDGSTFPVEISANHLRLGERDVHIAYARDITERKLAEQALRESEDKFRTLFENMTEAVALHDLVRDADGRAADYRILEVNPAYTRHAGISAESARGRLGSELYRSDPAPFLEEFARVALIGEPYLFEAYLPQLQRHFRISAISPKQGQFATVFEDITERRQREAELQQKTDELTRFTYTVSHDLKSPLVTIKTFLGFLDEDLRMQDHERIAKDIGFMRNAADKMTRLLDELIELSRIGRVVNAPVDVTLQALVKEALDLVAGRITERGVAVQVTEVPVTLHGDRSRLIEVFQNLLDNAVKFMGDQAQPRIAIEVEDTGKELVVVVTDNGIGIDPRHIHKLFGLFEKLDPGADGTGIGLALIKRIIEFHGGRIWVESPGLGRGTTFRFTVADMQRAA